jgi:hypothetical protein
VIPRRSFRALTAAALALAAAAEGCHTRTGEAPSVRGSGIPAAGDTVVLTAAAPRVVLPVDLERVPTSAEVAEVHLARVENPTGRAFSVRVRLVWGADASAAEGGAGVMLGTLGAFPAQQGGRFVLGVADELRQARAGVRAVPGGRAYVVLEVVPIAENRPLSASLRVHVAPILWRQAR